MGIREVRIARSPRELLPVDRVTIAEQELWS
jgi:hypothetical protein